jgi:glycerophosphoryl diester phosphodiesterase
VVAVCLVFAIGAASVAATQWQVGPRLVALPMLIVARRGDIGAWPENSLEGVVSAARKGADGIEFDLQKSADGTWYLFHDQLVDGRTNGTGDITHLTDSQIDALTITSGLRYHGPAGIHPPRLLEVLDALREFRGVLMLDVKSPRSADHAEIARLVRSRHLTAMVACYALDQAAAVKAVDKKIGTYMPSSAPNWVDRPFGVDAYLEYVTLLDWPVILLAPPGTVFTVVPERVTPDETWMLERADRYGATMFLTNRLDEALAWRSR